VLEDGCAFAVPSDSSDEQIELKLPVLDWFALDELDRVAGCAVELIGMASMAEITGFTFPGTDAHACRSPIRPNELIREENGNSFKVN
jgi:hypothetical protein